MKNFKKLFVLALAVIMCVTVLSVNSFAAFSPNVELKARYSAAGDKLYVSVLTDNSYGAIKATLTYNSALTLEKDSSTFVEGRTKVSDATDKFTEGTGTITFVLVTDKLGEGGGDKLWADFCFSGVGSVTSPEFVLDNISISNLAEEINDNTATLKAEKTITVAPVLNSLGAQYRKADTGVKAAIRFGSRIARANSLEGDKIVASATIKVGEEDCKVLACGHIIAFEDSLTQGNAFEAKYESNTVTAPDGASVIKATKYFTRDDDYIVHTVAAPLAKTENLTRTIVARPYVVYEKANGVAEILHGETMSGTYNGVKEAYDIVTGK